MDPPCFDFTITALPAAERVDYLVKINKDD
jgi:hypothetical protein